MNNKNNILQNKEKIMSYSIDNIISERFAKYAKYIILERALPDVRDGLKPVQRRILYAMNCLGLTNNKTYKKAARIIGEVIGKYHPHGDNAVYAAMCRMAQEWKLLWPLIEMHGNKGSIDGDNPAAMRYTEVKLSLISEWLLKDINKNTVNLNKNFDESEIEPTVLPGYFPNLLVNGSYGIAVGMATNIPPHNLQEVIDAIIMRINNPQCSLKELMNIIKGPDFPTGGIIQGIKGIEDAYRCGKGRIVIRSKTRINYKLKTPQIIITEIPFEVIKQDLIKKIDDVKLSLKVYGIKEVRDETDRFGLRIVVDLIENSNPQEILNYLFKNTNLQIYYNFNLVAIANKKPMRMSLINILDFYINHQNEVVTKRSQYDLTQLKVRLEIINGLFIALKKIEDIIKIIKNSNNKVEAKLRLISSFNFSNVQSEAIVNLRLYRLTSTDINLLFLEKKEIENKIIILKEILKNKKALNKVIIYELKNMNSLFLGLRKSKIKGEISTIIINEKDTLKKQNVFISISYDGWINIIINKSFSENFNNGFFNRKPNDIIIGWEVLSNYDNLLFFTNQGNYFLTPIFKLYKNKLKTNIIHISLLCKITKNEKIISVAKINNFENSNINLVFVTKYGLIKRVNLLNLIITKFNKIFKYIKLKEKDIVISINATNGNNYIIISTRNSMTLKYLESKIPLLTKRSIGVKALKLNLNEDEVVGMACGNNNDTYGILISTGIIKRILFSNIELTSRITKGNKILNHLKNQKIKIIKTFLLPSESFINILTKKEKWLVIKSNDIKISKINEINKKIISDEIIMGENNLILNLKNNVNNTDKIISK